MIRILIMYFVLVAISAWSAESILSLRLSETDKSKSPGGGFSLTIDLENTSEKTIHAEIDEMIKTFNIRVTGPNGEEVKKSMYYERALRPIYGSRSGESEKQSEIKPNANRKFYFHHMNRLFDMSEFGKYTIRVSAKISIDGKAEVTVPFKELTIELVEPSDFTCFEREIRR